MVASVRYELPKEKPSAYSLINMGGGTYVITETRYGVKKTFAMPVDSRSAEIIFALLTDTY